MKYFSTLVFVLAASISLMAQADAGNSRTSDKIVSAATVKLTIECNGSDEARFRFSNMTDWAVSVRTFSQYVHPTRYKRYQLQNGRRVFLLPSNEEIPSLIYTVETTRVIGGKPYTEYSSSGMDSFAQSWLAPRDSILFDVPLTSADDDATLYVYFNYEWEIDEKGIVRSGAVQHRVLHPGLSTEDKKIRPCK